ncbi:MAG: hypothetical protein ACRD2C_10430 [Acidimicrobiales bacterium]
MTKAATTLAAPGDLRGPEQDRVGLADRLRTDLTGRIDRTLSDAPSPGTGIYVGWVAALDAALCPARYRASGIHGWGFPGWSPPLAAAAIGRAALNGHLLLRAAPAHGLAITEPVLALPEPLEVVRAWVRDVARVPTSPVAEWVAELARDGDRATLAAAAANATRWVAGFVRVNGWPLPPRLGLISDEADNPFARRWPKRWRPSRGSSVTVASSPDAVVGKVAPAGRFGLLVHRPSSPTDGVLADRAAFEATAGALTSGIVADHVVVTTADSGERVRFPIDDALLARGLELVVGTVRQRVLAQGDWGFDDATPSAACHHCPERSGCEPGCLWLVGPGRWRGGLPDSGGAWA